MSRPTLLTFAFIAACLLAVCSCNNQSPKPQSQPMNNDECLICGSPLQYFESDSLMECVLCHKQVNSRVCCTQGHFVCDECHTSGIDSIILVCQQASSADPIEILETLMSMNFCHMHGPEHHVLVGASLLTAYRNAGGNINLNDALLEMLKRGHQVPGGACGYWGACGAAISTGMYVSIVTNNTPLSTDSWHLSNLMTSEALAAVANHGGPRCCKRDSYLSIQAAVAFTDEHLGVHLDSHPVTCSRSAKNNQCIGTQCPFNPAQ